MRTVPDIIDELGGATAISNGTGLPITTVHSWKRAQFVPDWRRPALIAFARKVGKPLSASDFPDARPNEVKAA